MTLEEYTVKEFILFVPKNVWYILSYPWYVGSFYNEWRTLIVATVSTGIAGVVAGGTFAYFLSAWLAAFPLVGALIKGVEARNEYHYNTPPRRLPLSFYSASFLWWGALALILTEIFGISAPRPLP